MFAPGQRVVWDRRGNGFGFLLASVVASDLTATVILVDGEEFVSHVPEHIGLRPLGELV